jgi:hypothetical protein
LLPYEYGLEIGETFPIPEFNSLPPVPNACEELKRYAFSTSLRAKVGICEKAYDSMYRKLLMQKS